MDSCVTVNWSDESGDHSVELPIMAPTENMGNKVIDISTLTSKTGFFAHDPGFTSTSSCESAITFIDGECGILLHRGYSIENLSMHCSFPEVAYLLLDGNLPNSTQLGEFVCALRSHTMVHENLRSFLDGFKYDAHPMAIMVGVVGALSAFYPDAVDIQDPETRRLSAIRIMAKMPTIAAMSYKTAIGQPFIYPQNNLSFAANFLHMMFATPCESYEVHPMHAAALEAVLILHADHEQNASTSTVRIASSSQASPFAMVSQLGLHLSGDRRTAEQTKRS